MALLLLSSLSHRFYQLTDPFQTPTLIFICRKAESVIAFALVGATLGRSWWRSALIVGLFSAFIEVAQDARGSAQTLPESILDVTLGVTGGAAGALLRQALASRRRAIARELP